MHLQRISTPCAEPIMTNIAIVGGGPGGLMAAYLIEQKFGNNCTQTLYEADCRIGGKVRTERFQSEPVIYEAGVAECYDYGMLGYDPLRYLVGELGLTATRTEGGGVVLDGTILSRAEDIERHYGPGTRAAIDEFRQRAASMLPLDAWYRSQWREDNLHPWAHATARNVLDTVRDPVARRYLEVAAHSDLATEPHLTTGLNGLKNFLMDVPGYVSQYSIDGGMEMLPRRLHERLMHTRVELGRPVVRIERTPDDRYRVYSRRGRETVSCDFDAEVVALPHSALCSLEWGGERLSQAMQRHIAYYDRPGHYLRISILFNRPFWRQSISGAWFMLDAFGGCCVYDESARHRSGGHGVLGWLLAGTDALTLGNLDDHALARRVLECFRRVSMSRRGSPTLKPECTGGLRPSAANPVAHL